MSGIIFIHLMFIRYLHPAPKTYTLIVAHFSAKYITNFYEVLSDNGFS